MRPERHAAVVIGAIVLTLVFASAVLLSNIREITGPVDAGEVVLGPIGSGCADFCIVGQGILNLRNDTTKEFAFNVTSQVNRTIDTFYLQLQFWMSGILAGGFQVLSFNWSIERVGSALTYLDPTPSTNTMTSWTANYSEVLPPFAAYRYTVSIHFIFIGGGDYTFQVAALDDRWFP